MFGLFTAGLACLAPLAAAYTTPTGTGPVGNPISQPGLNTIVPVDETFTITWDPTTKGTVSLVLLKGPAENLIPVYAIAEKIENSGSYTWDPKSTLEPSEGAKGYGIQLIDDATGQYQYTSSASPTPTTTRLLLHLHPPLLLHLTPPQPSALPSPPSTALPRLPTLPPQSQSLRSSR
jgi:hypothetical protein